MSLLTTAVLGGVLGASEFGVYVRSAAVMQAAGVLGSLGLGRYLIEVIPKLDESDVSAKVRQGLGTMLVVCVPIAMIASVLISGFRLAPEVFIGAGSTALVMALAGSLRAGGDEAVANILNGPAGGLLAQSALAIGIGATLMSSAQLDGSSAVKLHATALFVVATIAIGLQIRSAGRGSFGVLSVAEVRRSLPYGVNQGFALVPIDIILGSAVLSEAALGVYAVAKRLANVAALPLQVSNVASVRQISKSLGRGDSDSAQGSVSHVGSLALAISLPVTVLLLAVPGQILEFAFGADFLGGVAAVRILAIGLFLNVCTGPCGTVLAMGGHSTAVARTTAVAILGTVGAILVVGGNLTVEVLAAIVACATVTRFASMAWIVRNRMGIVTVPLLSSLVRYGS